MISAVDDFIAFMGRKKAELDHLNMLGSPENYKMMQDMYNFYINKWSKILKDNEKTGILNKHEVKNYKQLIKDAVYERNAFGLKEEIKIDEPDPVLGDTTKPPMRTKTYEHPSEQYPRQYLVDEIIAYPEVFKMNVLYPNF